MKDGPAEAQTGRPGQQQNSPAPCCYAATRHGAQNLDRTTHSSRNPVVNLNLGEPFCSTRRLHTDNWLSAGMRWDRDNAESIMALAGIYHSKLWRTYWKAERAA